MKRSAVLVLSVAALVIPVAKAETYYTYNGASIRPLFGDPHQESCARWTIWYFRRDAPKVQGAQWGSDTGKSPEEVIAARDQGIKDELAWQAGYLKWGVKYTLPNFTYLNSFGPICLIKGSIGDVLPDDQVDQALDQLEQATARLQKILGTVRKLVEANNGFPRTLHVGVFTPKIYDTEKGEVEEYVDGLKEQLEHVNALKNGLTRLNQPTLATVFNALEGVNRMVQQDESQLPGIKTQVTPIFMLTPEEEKMWSRLLNDPPPAAPPPPVTSSTLPVTYHSTDQWGHLLTVNYSWTDSSVSMTLGDSKITKTIVYKDLVGLSMRSDYGSWSVTLLDNPNTSGETVPAVDQAQADAICNFVSQRMGPKPAGAVTCD